MKAIDTLPLWVQLPAALLLVVGGVFLLVGALGMVRFGDFFMRLHAPTKASTLGVGGVLLASLLVSWAQGLAGLQVLLITLFVFITAPVAANLLGMAGLHLRLPSKAALPPEAGGGDRGAGADLGADAGMGTGTDAGTGGTADAGRRAP